MIKHPERGTALITALFIMAIIASASVAMLWRQQITLERTRSILDYHKAYLVSGGVLDWAKSSLSYNVMHPVEKTLVDVLPLIYKKTVFPGGCFQGRVVDAQAKFNINNLTQQDYHAGFMRLLTQVVPEIKDPAKLTAAIVAWLMLEGAHSLQVDDAYIKAGLGYTPSHKMMVDISELRLVLGVSAKIYTALKPYLIALPEVTPVNVNTAPATVLVSLSPHFTLEVINTLIKNRQKKPYLSVQDFMNDPIVKNHQVSHSKGVTVKSRYFLAQAFVRFSDEELTVNSLLRRDIAKNKQAKVSVLWQSQV